MKTSLINISKNFILSLSLIIFLSAGVNAQKDYTKTKIDLWEDGNVPFNKKDIALEEFLDDTGRRYSQISKPELYVYQKTGTKAVGPALLHIPGGGYAIVSIRKDGEGTAKKFLKMGFNTVAILKYRLPDTNIVENKENVPLCDAQKAISLFYKNKKSWNVDTNKIAVSGSSAGGHLAASLANLTDKVIAPGVKRNEIKHAVSILMYPVVSFTSTYRHRGSFKRLLGNKSKNQELLDYFSMEKQVSENTPSTFLIHSTDDKSVPFQNSKMYLEMLNKHNVKSKYVELKKGGHGFGFNSKRTGVDWSIQLKEWLNNETDLFN